MCILYFIEMVDFLKFDLAKCGSIGNLGVYVIHSIQLSYLYEIIESNSQLYIQAISL